MIEGKCEYDSGWEQGHVEGVLDERKRIIALARAKAVDRHGHMMEAKETPHLRPFLGSYEIEIATLNVFANELEAEDG